MEQAKHALLTQWQKNKWAVDDQCEHWVGIAKAKVTAFVARRARQPVAKLGRRTVLQGLERMLWDIRQSPVALSMWMVLRLTGDGPDGDYVRPNFKMSFFERIHEINPNAG